MARRKRAAPWCDTRDGIFYAFWYDDTKRETKRFSLRTTDALEAQARFAEFLLSGQELRRPRAGEMIVDRALDDYLKEHVEANCAAPDRQVHASNRLKLFFKDTLLDDVTVQKSQAYRDSRYKDGVTPGTVRRELNTLVAAANHAKWMKRTNANVSVDLPAEKRLGPDDEAPYLTKEEHAKLLALAESDPELYHFEVLLYQTAARRRSIEHLEREQVRVQQKRIVLQKAGKKSTKKRQPIVPIFRAMDFSVDWLLTQGGPRRLFTTPDFYRKHVALATKAGLDESKRHPHIIRHSRATHLLQDGKTIYDVAKLLGDTLLTVERVYGHHSAEHLQNSLEE